MQKNEKAEFSEETQFSSRGMAGFNFFSNWQLKNACWEIILQQKIIFNP